MRSVLALSVSVIALLATGCGTSSEDVAAFDAERSDFTPETVRDFSGFPLYSLGTQFEDLPLTAIVRVFGKPLVRARGGRAVPDNRTNHMNFIYGTCAALGGEGGCAPPLTVQIWPACDRTLQDYFYNTRDGGPSRLYELVTIRGVPTAKFSDMLELYQEGSRSWYSETPRHFGRVLPRASPPPTPSEEVCRPANRSRLPPPERWKESFAASGHARAYAPRTWRMKGIASRGGSGTSRPSRGGRATVTKPMFVVMATTTRERG